VISTVNESCSHDRGLQFCFQQSTAISARPQIDLLFRVLWHRLLHQNIPILEATAGFEYAGHLLQGKPVLSGSKLRTPLEIPHRPAIRTGNDSARPSRNSTLPTPASLALFLAISSIAGVNRRR